MLREYSPLELKHMNAQKARVLAKAVATLQFGDIQVRDNLDVEVNEAYVPDDGKCNCPRNCQRQHMLAAILSGKKVAVDAEVMCYHNLVALHVWRVEDVLQIARNLEERGGRLWDIFRTQFGMEVAHSFIRGKRHPYNA